MDRRNDRNPRGRRELRNGYGAIATRLASVRCLQEQIATEDTPQSRRLDRSELEPFICEFGITRVADVTGLDTLGLPCWNAIRPGARGLVVSSGKGLDHNAAWVSAVMESLEEAMAEAAKAQLPLIGTISHLANLGMTPIPLERQQRCASTRRAEKKELAWVSGVSLKDGSMVWAPYELVGLDLAYQSPWDSSLFKMSSVGLGAGSTTAAAVLHGLRELLEDEALFLATCLPMNQGAFSELAPIHCHEGHLLPKTIKNLESRGAEIGLSRHESEIGWPVFIASIASSDENGSIFHGYACREVDADAALEAILEAAQTRLTFISGAREDLFDEDYESSLRATRLPRPKLITADCEKQKDESQSLMRILKALKQTGIDGVYVFPLGGIDSVFHVVRVLVDDLATRDHAMGVSLPGRVRQLVLRELEFS